MKERKKVISAAKTPNKSGVYPTWCDSKRSKFNLEAELDTMLFLIEHSKVERLHKVLMNDIYKHLEKNEGFHYGLSKEFMKLEDKKQAITEHALPFHEMLKMIKQQNIKTKEDLLAFIVRNYYICLVTLEEDEKLRKAKLTRSMPKDWTEWTQRYEAVGIELVTYPGK